LYRGAAAGTDLLEPVQDGSWLLVHKVSSCVREKAGIVVVVLLILIIFLLYCMVEGEICSVSVVKGVAADFPGGAVEVTDKEG
jgi:hypothetical protein